MPQRELFTGSLLPLTSAPLHPGVLCSEGGGLSPRSPPAEDFSHGPALAPSLGRPDHGRPFRGCGSLGAACWCGVLEDGPRRRTLLKTPPWPGRHAERPELSLPHKKLIHRPVMIWAFWDEDNDYFFVYSSLSLTRCLRSPQSPGPYQIDSLLITTTARYSPSITTNGK